MIQNHKKLWMMGKCTQKFNQWDTQKPKLFIWGDRFFEKNKLGMALKQEIIVWIKTEFGLSTPLFEGSEKSPNRVIACFEAIQNPYQESKKSTSYTVNGWETKNSLRFVMPICHPFQI